MVRCGLGGSVQVSTTNDKHRSSRRQTQSIAQIPMRLRQVLKRQYIIDPSLASQGLRERGTTPKNRPVKGSPGFGVRVIGTAQMGLGTSGGDL